jgi:hypothetical protein
MIEIKDVKMKGNTDVKVSFIESDNGKVTEYVVSSNEAPRPEFIQAMCSLAPDLMEIIGISVTDGDKADERTNVLGCSFKHTADGNFNAVIKGTIYVPWLDADVAINTPNIGTRPKDAPLGAYLSDSTERKLRKVLKEAELYVSGKRAQEVLFDDEAGSQKAIGNMKLIG